MPPSPPSSPTSSPNPPNPRQNPPDPRQGEFLNGSWRCNCEPRLIAKIRTVNRNTEDYGKRFYGCPKERGKENSCNMFILVEDAKKRERDYLMSNGHSEKRQTTIQESMSARKGKRKAGDRTPPQENAGSRPAASGPSKLPAVAEASTSRRGGEDLFVQPDGFHDTTSEDEDEVEERMRRRRNAGTPTPRPTGAKRKRASQEEYLDDLSSSGAEELMAVTDKSSRTANALGKRPDTFITPSAVRTADMENGMVTPSLTKGRSEEEGMVTPSLTKGRSEDGDGVNRVLWPASEASKNNTEAARAKRQRLDNEDGAAATPSHASETSRIFGTDATIGSTPALSEVPSTLPPTLPPPRSVSPANLTKEVMDLLKDQDIAPLIRTELRKILEKHEAMARGYELGRDATRKAIKDAEERATRLQARIDDLENGKKEIRTALLGVWEKV
ncbi:hypothetical protein F5Y10DRAFT_248860 [Nemania abortiva]|nr:hypothetical protein F5Y10DRAFT_248860 [Nemania abortiva]